MSASRKQIICIFLAALIVRALLFLFSENTSGDPDVRLLMSLTWAKHPYWIHNIIWLPLHFYLIALAYKITGNIILGGRLVSLLFGSLTAIPFAVFASRFLNRRAWMLSCMFFVFSAIEIRLSQQSFAEVVTSFFFFSCLALLFTLPSKARPSYSRVAAAAACMLAANLTRQDVWVVLPVVFAAVWICYGFRRALIFASVNSLLLVYFAVAVLGYNERLSSYISLQQAHGEVRSASMEFKLITWIWYTMCSMSPIVAISAVAGYIMAIKRKEMVIPIAISGILLLSGLYASFVRGWVFQYRYLLQTSLLFTIFAAYWTDVLLARLPRPGRIAVLAAMVVAAVGLYGYTTICGRTSGLIPREPPFVVEVSRSLKDNVKGQQTFLIEDLRNQGPAILLHYDPGGKKISGDEIITKEIFTEALDVPAAYRSIQQCGASVLVLVEGGELESYVREHSHGRLITIETIGPYVICRLNNIP